MVFRLTGAETEAIISASETVCPSARLSTGLVWPKAVYNRRPGIGSMSWARKMDWPRKSPLIFTTVPAKGAGADRGLIQSQAVARDIFEPAEVQSFMGVGTGLPTAPPLLPGLKKHARMEKPVLETIQPGTVGAEQVSKEAAG